MNIFESATRQKLRFDTPKGALSVEALWDLPMTSTTGKLSLNDIGVGLQHALRDMGDFSLVDTAKPDPERTKIALRLDIIKSIIATKQAENAAQSAALHNKAEREKLMGLLAQKQDAALMGLSEAEIRARIAAL